MGGGTIEASVEGGGLIAGTPDDAIAAIEQLLEMSGGFGGFLARAHEWTTWDKMVRSYELWSRYVMPHFRGQIAPKAASRDWVANTPDAQISSAAVTKAFTDAGVEVPGGTAERATRAR